MFSTEKENYALFHKKHDKRYVPLSASPLTLFQILESLLILTYSQRYDTYCELVGRLSLMEGQLPIVLATFQDLLIACLIAFSTQMGVVLYFEAICG